MRTPADARRDEPERWRDIPGYDGRYQASTLGRIRHVFKHREPRIMRLIMSGPQKKHCVVNLQKKGEPRRQRTVLRLVAETFYPSLSDDVMVVHRNGLHADNRLKNVMILTPEECGRKVGTLSRRRAVLKISRSGEVLEIFPTLHAAAEAMEIARVTVHRHCEGLPTRPLPGGVSFRWDEGRPGRPCREAAP